MKTCKMCFKEIDERAKKCPFCQHWQTKLQSFYRNPASAIIAAIAIMAFGSWFIDSLFSPKHDFESFKNKIEITKNSIEFGNNSCGQTVAILGSIKNNSQIDWRAVKFEIVFYDNDNNVTDTEQIEKYSFSLPANEEVPFKLSMKKEFDDTRYIGHRIRIISAREKIHFLE